MEKEKEKETENEEIILCQSTCIAYGVCTCSLNRGVIE
jgi:hypothetical protein